MARQDSIDKDTQQVLNRLDELLLRMERLETYLGIPYHPGENPPSPSDSADKGAQLELSVGEYGLAWTGSITLFLGIIFLTIFLFRQGQVIAANSLAYATAVVCFFMSRFWKTRIPHLSRLMASGTIVFLFYATARFYFFTDHPLIGNSAIVISLLLPVIALQFFFAWQYRFAPFAALAMLLAAFTGLLADHAVATFTIIAIALAAVIAMSRIRSWVQLPLIGIFLAYGSHVLWALHNPVANHPLQLMLQGNPIYFLFIFAALYSGFAILSSKDFILHPFTIVTLILNCFLFSAITVAEAILQSSHVVLISFLAAALMLVCSVIQWQRTRLQLPATIFASFGFLNLSISIAVGVDFPGAFIWLALQSLLVLCMSLWFRSKALVVINSIIYCSILVAYGALSPASHLAIFMFAFVALISARVLNWQKDRLTLQTGALRNVYLGIAFVLILFGLYKVSPPQYVTLCWTAAAVGYFFISYLLKNVKYRWMGTLALLLTVIYLMVIDLPRLNMAYRIVAFLFLGVMTLVISLFYTRLRHLLGSRRS